MKSESANLLQDTILTEVSKNNALFTWNGTVYRNLDVCIEEWYLLKSKYDASKMGVRVFYTSQVCHLQHKLKLKTKTN